MGHLHHMDKGTKAKNVEHLSQILYIKHITDTVYETDPHCPKTLSKSAVKTASETVSRTNRTVKHHIKQSQDTPEIQMWQEHKHKQDRTTNSQRARENIRDTQPVTYSSKNPGKNNVPQFPQKY